MQAKGVIRRQVQWAESRSFFYWRLRRRLEEFKVANACAEMDTAGARKQAIQRLQQWYLTQQKGDEASWKDDQVMVAWFEQHAAQVQIYIAQQVCATKMAEIGDRLTTVARLSAGTKGSEDVLKKALSGLSAAEKAQIINALK